MIERRISQHRWDDLPDEEKQQVKIFTRKYADRFGFDFEFQYYWMRFTDENWVLGNITDAQTAGYLT